MGGNAAAGLRELPTVVISVDPGVRVIEWNPTAERLLGWSAAEACGRSLVDLVGGEEAAGHLLDAIAEAAGARVVKHRIEPLRLLRRDGQPVRFDVWATHRSGDQAGVVLSLTDLTERWRADWLKDHRLGVLQALASSAEDAALPAAVEQIALSVKGTEARLWETDARGALQLRVAWSHAGNRRSDGVTAAQHPAQPSWKGRSAAGGCRSRRAADPGDCLGIPVKSDEQVLGAIEISAPDYAGFDDACVAHLTGAGSYLGIYLARRRSRGRLRAEPRGAEPHQRRAPAADAAPGRGPRGRAASRSPPTSTTTRSRSWPRCRSGCIPCAGGSTTSRPSAALEAVEEMVGSAVSRLRSMMFNLRPTGLDRGDLLGPLRERLEQMRRRRLHRVQPDRIGAGSSSPPTAASPSTGSPRRRSPTWSSTRRRRNIDVTVKEQDGGCLLRIADDGIGPGGALRGPSRPPRTAQPAAERAELAGGWLRVEPGERAGTVVSAWVPLPSPVGRDGGYAR